MFPGAAMTLLFLNIENFEYYLAFTYGFSWFFFNKKDNGWQIEVSQKV